MDYSDKIAKRMPISLVDADESAKIAGIRDAMLQLGSTPAEVRSPVWLDQDFIPDALQAFRFRCDEYFAKTEKWLEAR